MRRREQVPESKRFAAAAVAGLVGALTSFMATVPASAAPNASSRVVLDGPARFEVLTPTLVRLEYAADGHFEDGATFNVVDRNLPVPKFRTRKDGGWLAITTDRLQCVFATRCEAEDGRINGGESVNYDHPGFTGRGFTADYGQVTASDSWTVTGVPSGGDYTLQVRYANGGAVS